MVLSDLVDVDAMEEEVGGDSQVANAGNDDCNTQSDPQHNVRHRVGESNEGRLIICN